MVATAALGLAGLLGGLAHAQSLAVGPSVAVVGGGGAELRPGLRLGFEPSPVAGLDVVGAVGLDGHWDAGLGLTGRAWFGGTDDVGIYAAGRFVAGIAGGDALSPWTGLGVGMGGRPLPWLDVSALVGPDWARAEDVRWRSELALTFVLGPDTLGSGVGQGTVRHKPRKPD